MIIFCYIKYLLCTNLLSIKAVKTNMDAEGYWSPFWQKLVSEYVYQILFEVKVRQSYGSLLDYPLEYIFEVQYFEVTTDLHIRDSHLFVNNILWWWILFHHFCHIVDQEKINLNMQQHMDVIFCLLRHSATKDSHFCLHFFSPPDDFEAWSTCAHPSVWFL